MCLVGCGTCFGGGVRPFPGFESAWVLDFWFDAPVFDWCEVL